MDGLGTGVARHRAEGEGRGQMELRSLWASWRQLPAGRVRPGWRQLPVRERVRTGWHQLAVRERVPPRLGAEAGSPESVGGAEGREGEGDGDMVDVSLQEDALR